MAPTFFHSKASKVLFNNVDMSAILTDTTVSAEVDSADTTVFGNSDRTFIPGTRTGTVDFEGLYDGTALSTASTASTGALDHRFAAALGASTNPVITFGPSGDTLGRRAVMVSCVGTEYTATAITTDAVRVSASAQFTGRQDYGVWLHALAARTSTSSTFASVDSGVVAGTTLGGVAHFHLIADSTITTVVVKIQHSSNNSAWSDLITFTGVDETTQAAAVQRSTVSGTVKRYTRTIISTFTGGAGKSATFATAFARRNKPVF